MMKDNMKHVCACLLGVVLLCVSATAQAAVDFDEGFEYSGNAAWLGSGNWAASSCTAAEHTGIRTMPAFFLNGAVVDVSFGVAQLETAVQAALLRQQGAPGLRT